VYLHGLLLDGERKSIEPLSRRVPGGNEQALQQFINQSPVGPDADLAAYRARMAAAFAADDGVIVVDDTGFPKQGRHSVGVARQYSGTLGKRANCQVATSLHYASGRGDYPLALRLYLPGSVDERSRSAGAGRVSRRTSAPSRPSGRSPSDLLDEVRAERLPHALVVADAGYGVATELREGLEQRRERYIVGVTGDTVALIGPTGWVPRAPKSKRGRPATASLPGGGRAAPGGDPHASRDVGADDRLLARGHEGQAGSRVRLGSGLAGPPVGGRRPRPMPSRTPRRPPAGSWWSGGEMEHQVRPLQLALRHDPGAGGRLWKERWQVERGYEQLKGELGLDHFEGRSWPGFHHHAAMTFLAYGFLALERQRAQAPADGHRPRGSAPGGAGRGA
jgi:SRSO17 transposase